MGKAAFNLLKGLGEIIILLFTLAAFFWGLRKANPTTSGFFPKGRASFSDSGEVFGQGM